MKNQGILFLVIMSALLFSCAEESQTSKPVVKETPAKATESPTSMMESATEAAGSVAGDMIDAAKEQVSEVSDEMMDQAKEMASEKYAEVKEQAMEVAKEEATKMVQETAADIMSTVSEEKEEVEEKIKKEDVN